MAIREILTQGDPLLEKVCHPVTKFDGKLHALLQDMHQTLKDADGYGLAAPQIGILRRVVLVTASDGSVLELINPTILATSGECRDLEGCLSVPGRYGYVTRPTWAKVEYQDRHGNLCRVEDVGMTARCFCHECEHLDGHLFTEHTDKLYTSAELDEME